MENEGKKKKKKLLVEEWLSCFGFLCLKVNRRYSGRLTCCDTRHTPSYHALVMLSIRNGCLVWLTLTSQVFHDPGEDSDWDERREKFVEEESDEELVSSFSELRLQEDCRENEPNKGELSEDQKR